MKNVLMYYGRKKTCGFSPHEQRLDAAIEKAIAEASGKKDGEERLRLYDIYFFKQTHTVQGAAQCIPCSEATATRWINDLVDSVGRNIGYID